MKCKTYWRITHDIIGIDVQRCLKGCDGVQILCLGNTASHQAQQILGSLSVHKPFDIIAIDIWITGGDNSKLVQSSRCFEVDASELKTRFEQMEIG